MQGEVNEAIRGFKKKYKLVIFDDSDANIHHIVEEPGIFEKIRNEAKKLHVLIFSPEYWNRIYNNQYGKISFKTIYGRQFNLEVSPVDRPEI